MRMADSSILGREDFQLFCSKPHGGYLLLLVALPNWATITATTKATWIGWPQLPPSVSHSSGDTLQPCSWEGQSHCFL